MQDLKKEGEKLLLRIPTSFNWEESVGPKTNRLISPEEAFSFIGNYFKDAEFQEIHQFREISSSKLIALRKKAIAEQKPIAIVKVGTQYYYCPTLRKHHSIFCRFHQCNSCLHCTALPTNQGGCDKVLAVPLSNSFYCDENNQYHRFDFLHSKRLEKYPFLHTAVEEVGLYREKNGTTLQCKGDKFFVFNCKNFIAFSKNAHSSFIYL